MGRHDLDVFLAPRSVAVIGVSRRTGKGSFNVIENMLEFGYKGEIYPVNPLADEIMGIRTYKEVREIDRPVDLALVSTPREEVPRITQECAGAGIKGAIVIPQGFADADAEGKALQEQLTALSLQSGIRILGPNTLGVVNAFSGFTSSFMPLRREKAPVALICQSGVFFVGSSLFTGVMGKGIDIGNGCDVDFADALEYFGEDDEVEVIFVHIEGMKGARRFLEAAKKIALRKPVLGLKTARSRQGAQAASSHSGALVGDHQVFEAAFRQAGVIPVRDQDDVFDFTKAFLRMPPMKGNRVGMITFTGAGGIMLIDSFQECGLEVVELSPRTVQGIKNLSPAWMPIQNPMDIWPALMKHGMNDVYRAALEGVLRDEAVDAVICIAIAPELPENAHLDATKTIRETAAALAKKPVVAWLYGPKQQAVGQKLEEGGKVLSLPSLPRAAKTLSALHMRWQFLNETVSYPSRYSVSEDGKRVLEICRGSGQRKMEGEGAHQLLSAYGIPMARSRMCRDVSEALKAGEEIGYPVALKVSSPQIIHKSDVGGVSLNLRGPKALEEAYQRIWQTVRDEVPGAELDGIFVQEMVEDGFEVILGAKRDLQFGPILIFGTGGIYTEVWKDVTYGIAPISRQDAERMILETKCHRVLKGIRGGKEYDMELLMECLLRLSQFMLDLERVEEIDINPFKVFSNGGMAVDARIVLSSASLLTRD